MTLPCVRGKGTTPVHACFRPFGTRSLAAIAILVLAAGGARCLDIPELEPAKPAKAPGVGTNPSSLPPPGRRPSPAPAPTPVAVATETAEADMPAADPGALATLLVPEDVAAGDPVPVLTTTLLPPEPPPAELPPMPGALPEHNPAQAAVERLEPRSRPPSRPSAPVVEDSEPHLRVTAYQDAFARALEAENAARELARRDPDHLSDEERGFLEKALAEYRAIAAQTGRGEAYAAANWGVGRVEYRLGRLWPAFEAMERSFPDHLQPEWVEARTGAQRRVGDALYGLGHRPVADAFDENGDRLSGYAAASRVYAAVAYNDANGPDAAYARLRQGDSLYELNRLDDAGRAYAIVGAHYASAPEADAARARLAQIAVARPGRHGEVRAEALEQAERLLAETDTPYLSDDARARRDVARAATNEEQAKALLAQAQIYTNKPRPTRRERAAGVFLLRDLLKRYPDTLSAEVARAMLAQWGVAEVEPAAEVAAGT